MIIRLEIGIAALSVLHLSHKVSHWFQGLSIVPFSWCRCRACFLWIFHTLGDVSRWYHTYILIVADDALPLDPRIEDLISVAATRCHRSETCRFSSWNRPQIQCVIFFWSLLKLFEQISQFEPILHIALSVCLCFVGIFALAFQYLCEGDGFSAHIQIITYNWSIVGSIGL